MKIERGRKKKYKPENSGIKVRLSPPVLHKKNIVKHDELFLKNGSKINNLNDQFFEK